MSGPGGTSRTQRGLRVRKRTIRFGDYTFFGSELRQSDSIEAVLIPRLEREHGPHHRLVHEARRHAEQLREAEMEKLARAIAHGGSIVVA
jgi:hypothetical protein